MLSDIDNRIAQLKDHKSLPATLDDDSILALVAYTYDNNVDQQANVYYALNRALRARQSDPAAFRQWRGYLYFLT